MATAAIPAASLAAPPSSSRQVIQYSSPSSAVYSPSPSALQMVMRLSVYESETSPSTTSSLKIPSAQQSPAAQVVGASTQLAPCSREAAASPSPSS